MSCFLMGFLRIIILNLLFLPTMLSAQSVDQISEAIIELSNGDRLSGTILRQSADSIELQHPLLGILIITRDQVVSVTPVMTYATQPLDADQGILATGFLKDWERELVIGIHGAEGNSTNRSIHMEYNMELDLPELRSSVNSAYDLITEDGEATENKLFISMERDLVFPGTRWFWLESKRLDWDDFKDWRYRFGWYRGIGYQLMDTEEWRVKTQVGLGGSYVIGGQAAGILPEGLIGLEGRWRINTEQSLSAKTTFYHEFEDLGIYRNITNLNWKIDISDFQHGLALKLGLTNEYESRVSADQQHNDFRYNLSLALGL